MDLKDVDRPEFYVGVGFLRKAAVCLRELIVCTGRLPQVLAKDNTVLKGQQAVAPVHT